MHSFALPPKFQGLFNFCRVTTNETFVFSLDTSDLSRRAEAGFFGLVCFCFVLSFLCVCLTFALGHCLVEENFLAAIVN